MNANIAKAPPGILTKPKTLGYAALTKFDLLIANTPTRMPEAPMPSSRCKSMMHHMQQSQQAFALLDASTYALVYANPVMTAFAKRYQVLSATNLFTDLQEVLAAVERCAQTGEMQTLALDAADTRLEFLPMVEGDTTVAIQCWALQAAPSTATAAPTSTYEHGLQAQFEAILQQFPYNVFLCNPNGEIFWTNQTSNRFKFGTEDIADFSNTSWVDPMHPDDFDYACKQFSTGMAVGHMENFQFRLRKHTGEYHWMQCLATPIRDANGAIQFWVGCNADVDKFKHQEDKREQRIAQLEKQVHKLNKRLENSQRIISHSQKIELVSSLAGGVAHDLNNLLFVMGLNTDLVQRKVQDPKLSDNLKAVRDSIRKAGRLSSQLAGFSGRKPESAKVASPHALLEDAEDLLRKAVGAEVEFTTSIDDDTRNILVDKTYLENALINLAINARDAVGGRGIVQLHIGNTQHVHDGKAHPYVEFRMHDSGSGMTEATLERVFEPFFTTKPPGSGTGLGLPMVKNFVDNSNGLVQIMSAPGVGSTISLLFPSTAQAAEDEPHEVECAAEEGNASVLVVEDDSAVREAVSEALCGLGYRIVAAANPEHAILYLQGGLRVDLVVSDVKMPGKLTVTDLIAHMKAHQPGIPILFATGYSADIAVQEGLIEGQYPVLFKPFSMVELASKVRALLPAQVA